MRSVMWLWIKLVVDIEQNKGETDLYIEYHQLGAKNPLNSHISKDLTNFLLTCFFLFTELLTSVHYISGRFGGCRALKHLTKNLANWKKEM